MLSHDRAHIGLGQRRRRPHPLRRTARLLAAASLAFSALGLYTAPSVIGATPPATQGACRPLAPGSAAQGRPGPTSLATIAAAYTCVLAHYPAGNALDDRTLLHGALAGMVGYLTRQGLDRANATLPALSGDRTADWQAFARSYTAIAERLPQSAGVFLVQGRAVQQDLVQQELAAAAIGGLVAGLNDDHAHYIPAAHLPGIQGKRIVRAPSGTRPPMPGAQRPVPGSIPGPGQAATSLGLHTSYPSHPTAAPSTSPLFIRGIDPGSPAARAGLRPGDVITAIDGAPPFSGGVANQGAIDLLAAGSAVQLTIQRPATGHSMTIRLTPASYTPPPVVDARLLAGNVAYVQLRQFAPGASEEVFAALRRLGAGRTLAGVVLDLRGNGGGDAAEPPRLLGAFVHGATLTLLDDGRGHRTAVRTDDRVPLLHLPLVALIDGGCASACDAIAAAIHDLQLGRLVGARTAGSVSGVADLFGLDDGSVLELPLAAMTGPAGEKVDGIGVPPDDGAPLTAAALSAGDDPGIDQALRDLRGMRDPMIDVGGYRLHLHCTGSGSPTVVLDAGLGDDWTTWDRVQPALSRTTRVCSYDRAGDGLSDFGPTPRTGARMVAELRTLLERAHIPGPYVLVGHSQGGTNVLLYTLTHRAEVAGLVLVDAAVTERQPTRNTVVAPANPAGPSGATEPGGGGTEEGNAVQADFAELAAALAAARHGVGALPLIALTYGASHPAGLTPGTAAKKSGADFQQVAPILRLSTNSEHIIALRSGHYIQDDQPNVVIAAVNQVVEAVRHHTALPRRGQVVRAG